MLRRRGYGEKFDEAFAALKPMAISMIGIIPLAPVREMNPKGRLLVFAFAVPAAFAFGDHLGYVASVESSMVLPMIAAKLTAGILALLLANLMAGRVLKVR